MSIIQIIAPTGAPGPFLDSLQTSLFSVYGLNLLLSAYGTGKAVTVRRSSDNTTQDIHFLSNGNLDTASLLTFCGSGDGFVVTWYDQTAAANNITQATTTEQPKIVSAGTYLGTVFFDGVDDFLLCVNNNNSPTGCSVYWGGTLRAATRQIIACSDNTDSGGPTSTSGIVTAAFENTFSYLQYKLFTNNYANAIVNEGTTSGGTTNIVFTGCADFTATGSSNRNTVYNNGVLLAGNYSMAGTIPTSTTLFASKWTIGSATEAGISRPASVSLINFAVYEAFHSSGTVASVEAVLGHYV